MSKVSFPIRWVMWPSFHLPIIDGGFPIPHYGEKILVIQTVRQGPPGPDGAVLPIREMYVGNPDSPPDYVSWGLTLSDLRATFKNVVLGHGTDFNTVDNRYYGNAHTLDTLTISSEIYDDLFRMDVFLYCGENYDYTSQSGWLASWSRPTMFRVPAIAHRNSGLGVSDFVFTFPTWYGTYPISSGDFTFEVKIDDETTRTLTKPFRAFFTTPNFNPGPLPLLWMSGYNTNFNNGYQTSYVYQNGLLPLPRQGFYRPLGTDQTSESADHIIHHFERSFRAAPRAQYRMYDHEGRTTDWAPYYLGPVPDAVKYAQDPEYQTGQNTSFQGGGVMDGSPSWHPEGTVDSVKWGISNGASGLLDNPLRTSVSLTNRRLFVQASNTDGSIHDNINRAIEPVTITVNPASEGALAYHAAGPLVKAVSAGNGVHDEANGLPAEGTRLLRSMDGKTNFQQFASKRVRGIGVWTHGHDLYLFGRKYEDDRWHLFRQTGWDQDFEELPMIWDEHHFHATAARLVSGILISLALYSALPPENWDGRGTLKAKISFDDGAAWKALPDIGGASGRWHIVDGGPARSSRIIITNGQATKYSDDHGQTWSDLT